MSKVYSNESTAILCVDMAVNEGRNVVAVEDMFVNVDSADLEAINTKCLNGLNKQISKLCLEQLNTDDKKSRVYKLLYNAATTHARRLFFAACEVFNNTEYDNINDAFTKSTFYDLWQAGQRRKGTPADASTDASTDGRQPASRRQHRRQPARVRASRRVGLG